MRARRWSEIKMTERGETNDFDRWVAALQEAILERERALFSAKVLAEAYEPKNMGVMDEPDGYGLVFGPCGDMMEVFVRLNGKRIEKATFMTDGCGPTVACGSLVTQMVEGKTLDEAAALEAEDLIIALDGLPPEHIHCATLAVNTLGQAISACGPDRAEGAA
jgi:nitrogen fixation NifU-like protein